MVANRGQPTIVRPEFEGRPASCTRTGPVVLAGSPAHSHILRDTKGELSMFITPAYAQGAGGGSDFMVQLIPILLMFVIFYFLLIRPQQARVKQHQQLIANIRRGDTVVTGGGIVGVVTKVKDDGELEVEIAKDTRIRVIKGTIAEVRVKGEPVKESA
jgi:preprotein translocase subunit YajC